MATTQDYLDAIKSSYERGKKPKINFGELPPDVNKGEIAKALMSKRLEPLQKAAAQVVPAFNFPPASLGAGLAGSPENIPPALGAAGGMVGGVPGAAAGGGVGELIRMAAERTFVPEAPSAGLGRVAGQAALQGASAIPAGAVGSVVAKRLGSGARKLMETTTGISRQNIQRLYNEPSAFLRGLRNQFTLAKERAGTALGAARSKSGLPVSLSPSEAASVPALKSRARKILENFETFRDEAGEIAIRLKEGAQVSREDAFKALKGVGEMLSEQGRSNENRMILEKSANLLDQLSEGAFPAVEAAKKRFASEALGDEFMRLFPRTVGKVDRPAIAKSGMMLAGPAAAGQTGARELSAFALPFFPPAVGAITAGAGMAGKVLGNQAARRTIASKIAQALGEYFK